MPDTTSDIRGLSATVVSGDRAGSEGTDDYGAIDTGVVVKIRGDDIEQSHERARAILACISGATARSQAREGHRQLLPCSGTLAAGAPMTLAIP